VTLVRRQLLCPGYHPHRLPNLANCRAVSIDTRTALARFIGRSWEDTRCGFGYTRVVESPYANRKSLSLTSEGVKFLKLETVDYL